MVSSLVRSRSPSVVSHMKELVWNSFSARQRPSDGRRKEALEGVKRRDSRAFGQIGKAPFSLFLVAEGPPTKSKYQESSDSVSSLGRDRRLKPTEPHGGQAAGLLGRTDFSSPSATSLLPH